MSDWSTLLDSLNETVRDTFASVDSTTGQLIQATYTTQPTLTTNPVSFPITLLFLNPIRLEGQNPGNFTLRWGWKKDFDEQSVVPVKGDQVAIDGVSYYVEQVQQDGADGVKLMLLKA